MSILSANSKLNLGLREYLICLGFNPVSFEAPAVPINQYQWINIERTCFLTVEWHRYPDRIYVEEFREGKRKGHTFDSEYMAQVWLNRYFYEHFGF